MTKESCNLIGRELFRPISQEQQFSQAWGLCRKLINHNTLHFMPFPAKINDSILRKGPKTHFLSHFGHFLLFFGKKKIFEKMTASYQTHYGFLPSCKKLQKTVKRFRRYSSLKNRVIWLAESFLGYNSRTRVFPDMRFSQNDREP